MTKIDVEGIPPELLQLVPQSLAREEGVLPLARDALVLMLAYAHERHSNTQGLERRLRRALRMPLLLVPFREEELLEAIEYCYREAEITACGLSLKEGYRCPRSWQSLVPTESPDVRYCTACERPVFYCQTAEELNEHTARGDCVAFASEPEDLSGRITMGMFIES